MSKTIIGIVNCGIGNFQSLTNALRYISDSTLVVTVDIDQLDSCDRLIFPGVGSFRSASSSNNLKLLSMLIQSSLSQSRPVLGICLGMQLLFQSSSEGGINQGLSFFHGDVTHFTEHVSYSPQSNLLIPHVGFNTVKIIKDCRLFHDIPDNSKFYFTHSYHAPSNLSSAIGLTDYGGCLFTSAASSGCIHAVQFHPELSGKMGLKLLKNFISLN